MHISANGVQVSDGPVCDFGDTLRCNTFKSIDCAFLGLQNGPNKMSCRTLAGLPLSDLRSPDGLCLDETASGPAGP